MYSHSCWIKEYKETFCTEEVTPIIKKQIIKLCITGMDLVNQHSTEWSKWNISFNIELSQKCHSPALKHGI